MTEKLFKQDGEIKREFTPNEYAQYELDKIENAKIQEEFLAKQTDKGAAQAKLASLGLTTDDLKALGLGGN